MADFIIPSFLEEQDTESVFERMLVNLPVDIDVSEGGHPYNLLYPTAYEISYMAEYLLAEAVKLIFPAFCDDYAEIVDYHAKTRGLSRKQPEYATGEVVVTGDVDCEIPEGTMFSTISVNGEASVDFLTTADADLGAEGVATIPVQSVLEGKVGNVPANTIVLNASRIDGITNVTNPSATTGGLEEESTATLQERIIEYDESVGYSYGGTESDYKRWALAVEGTGSVTIIAPTDDSGVIQLVLMDANGEPASQSLCTAVYSHIMSPDDESQRLAPINDKISVTAPSVLAITVSATIKLTDGSSIDEAKNSFVTAIKAYLLEAADEGEIKYTRVGSELLGIDEVDDYSGLTINGGTSNITLPSEKIPTITTANITFTV